MIRLRYCSSVALLLLLFAWLGPLAPCSLFHKTHAFVGSSSRSARRVAFRSSHQLFIKKSILLVDDEEGIRTAVGTLLQENGYTVQLCEDATSALRTLQANHAFDAIVTDVRMPGPSGLDFTQTIRQQQQQQSIPIILLTAAGQPNDRIAGYQAGADAYLPKPFDPDELLAILDRLIDRSISMADIYSELDGIRNSLQQSNHEVFLAADETQVLDYVCEGWTTKEIANALFLSTRRVDQLLSVLFRKAQVKNRTELVRWAIRTGKVKL